MIPIESGLQGITLERLHFAVHQLISDEYLHCLNNAELEQYHDVMIRAMVWNLRDFVLAEKLEETKHSFESQWPATWWQMFKKQYFPEWLQKRFPIIYHHEKEHFVWRRYATYPKLALALPNKASFFVIKEQTSVDPNDFSE